MTNDAKGVDHLSKGEGESVDKGLVDFAKATDHLAEGEDQFDGETTIDAI